jgi:hypothetical protein
MDDVHLTISEQDAGQYARSRAKLALGRKKSVDFNGYWQRHSEPARPKAVDNN